MSSRLDEIARQAGVSKASVSRVLNERPGVSARTRRAVLTALDVLGYERPTGLRPRSAGLVGLVMPELESPVYPLFAQVIETNLSRQGYTPVLCSQTPEGAGEDEYVGMLLDRGVAGIVFVAGLHADTALDHKRYDDLVAQRLPLVFVNGYARGLDALFVSCDDRAAGELAVAHLARLGHRRIGLLSPSDRHVSALRHQAGYRAAMDAHAGGFDPRLVDVAFPGIEGGYAGALRLLRREATALVCGSDLMALGAIRAVRGRGLRVPQDVSVVGYDDAVVMGYTDPPLTTVRQPALSMGTASARALIDQIRGVGVRRTESLFLPELVVRESTAAPAPGR
ncbi:LacI family DNA-binding transcriptional regulator [Kitasatospora phosalacinea]|uniref:LacI family DNA-binding transcriptional regulator n=1 Tax=Kitasatospora phosalacinea TaxID=2065 RepID=A0ABW6GM68_9ACTN